MFEHNPVLAAMDVRSLEPLRDRAVPRKLRRGQFLFLGGETAKAPLLLQEGVIRLEVPGPEGPTLIGISTESDLIGEIEALDGLEHQCDALCVTEVTVAQLDTDIFRRALNKNPAACLELARVQAERASTARRTLAESLTSDCKQRVVGRILDFADQVGRRNGDHILLEMPVDQRVLGTAAGASREETCRALSQLRRLGWLDYKGRSMRLLRPDLLEKLRCAGRASELSRSEDVATRRRSRSTLDT
jgi:CRP-like cAMP-binding protein